ncbi:AgrD family cyclic lactone autoinducer peptide [Halonatronum saccharophilum]|nr:cyclic lactone autoinducer peptide [Halonatronum saccharophilum]
MKIKKVAANFLEKVAKKSSDSASLLVSYQPKAPKALKKKD